MAYQIKNIGALTRETRRVADDEIRAALRDLRNAPRRPDVMHAVRSRCKKLRALLRLVRSGLDDRYADENWAFRDIARGLSEFRDTNVMRATLDSLLALHGATRDRRSFERLAALLSRRLESRHDDSTRVRALADAQAALTGAATRATRWRVRGRPLRVVAKGLGKTYGDARRLFEDARATRAAHDFHEWRKEVKYHWLQLRLVRPHSSKAFPGRTKRVALLSTALGDLHDLDVLESWLTEPRTHASAASARALTRVAAAERSRLHATALALGETLFAHDKRAFTDAFKHDSAATARRTR